jgi:hypothetical protein
MLQKINPQYGDVDLGPEKTPRKQSLAQLNLLLDETPAADPAAVGGPQCGPE